MALASVAEVATIFGAVVATVALYFVVRQLQTANRLASAQATIQFQEKFRSSYEQRTRLFREFPIHESLPYAREPLAVWHDLSDLTPEQDAAARFVVGAFNDVAQYVRDGLPLRSALAQYHQIFVQLGSVLLPYVVLNNRPTEGGEPSRFGRRVPILYNVALAYHRTNPIHQGRVLSFRRGEEEVLLLGKDGEGLDQFDRFPGEGSLRVPETNMRAAIRAAEKMLRLDRQPRDRRRQR